MPQISLETLGKLSALIGHQLRLEQKKRGEYVAICTCGYLSVKKLTVAIALGSAQHHQELSVRAWEASGKPWPTKPRVRPQDTPGSEQAFESRPSVVA